jgi:Na+/alanine symporter
LENVNGIEITQSAFEYHAGSFGEYIVMIAVILFAFSTIVSGYYYGESSLKFLFKKIKPIFIFIFKLLVIALLLMGSMLPPTIIWDVVDIFVVFMAIINIYTLLMLRKEVINEYDKYKK